MELLFCKGNPVQEQQPFSALAGLQNPLKEEPAVLAFYTRFPAQNERLLFGTARREIMTFIQPATRQCHVILLSSKLHQTPLSCKHNIFHCKTLMPPYSQVCHHISRSTPMSLLITSWAGDSPSSSRWSKQTFLVGFFL